MSHGGDIFEFQVSGSWNEILLIFPTWFIFYKSDSLSIQRMKLKHDQYREFQPP